MADKITAKVPTYLKKLPVQASDLEIDQKIFCDVGKTFPVSSHRMGGNHTLVELNYGAGKWYIFTEHWDCSWESEDIPEAENPAVGRQIERISKYLQPGRSLNLKTDTKYFSQRDNYRDPFRTCNSSSNAMYCDWLKRATGGNGLPGDNDFIKRVFRKGDTIYHGNQTAVLKEYGFDTKWMTDGDLPFVIDLLKAGFPVVVNILHRGSLSQPTGGHVIMLNHYDVGAKMFSSRDPFGTLISQYQVHNGAHSPISLVVFKKRWQKGYRILA